MIFPKNATRMQLSFIFYNEHGRSSLLVPCISQEHNTDAIGLLSFFFSTSTTEHSFTKPIILPILLVDSPHCLASTTRPRDAATLISRTFTSSGRTGLPTCVRAWVRVGRWGCVRVLAVMVQHVAVIAKVMFMVMPF